MAAGPEPDAFTDTFVAMAGAQAIITATRTGLVAALAERPSCAADLARSLGLEPVGVEALLGALAALGYVQASAEGLYRPTAAGAQLTPGASGSVAEFVGSYNADAWEMLGRLEDALRDRSVAASHARPADDPFWEHYLRGLFELARDEHEDNAALVPVSEPRRMLDMAGGHGAFAMAMCRRFPGVRATVFDLPASAAVGRRIVAEEGFAERVEFREGDALREPLGEQLDVLSAFNLLHHLAPADVQRLLARAREALTPAGVLVIGETERSEPGVPPSRAGAMSGVVYFASSGTRNYSRAELEEWLSLAGFADVQVHRAERSPWRLLYLARS
ncbi:MAG TPA: methyltransferase [Solirubrobacteraceae bacterium]|nr:methyltransferase [Solirubrobacteraceae bacterium]